MEKKQQNQNSPRQHLSSADQHFDTSPTLHSLAPPALQLKANGTNGEGELEQEKGAYQLKEKEFTSGDDDNPSENPSSDTPFQLKENTNSTGLPDNLKSGVENLSGFSLDDVKVHYNSSQPAQLKAHAYAQGTDIHLGPGQEKHLPHEAWHVVQQKQGRVQPTTQLKGKFQVNDDKGLEKEADEMGAKAINHPEVPNFITKSSSLSNNTIQRVGGIESEGRNAVRAKQGEKAGASDTLSMLNLDLIAEDNAMFNSQMMNTMKWSDPNTDTTHETRAFNITGISGATLGIVFSFAEAIDNFKDGDYNAFAMSLIDIGANSASLASGVAGVISDYTTGDTNKEASKASGAAFFTEGILNTVKNGYKTIKNIYDVYQSYSGKTPDWYTGGPVKPDTNEKMNQGIEIFTNLLETGVGIIKMLKHAVSEKFGFISDASSLGKFGTESAQNFMPLIGLVMSVIDIAKRVVDIIRAGLRKADIRKKLASILIGGGRGDDMEELETGDKWRDKRRKRIKNNKVLNSGKKSVFETKNSKTKRQNSEAAMLNGLNQDKTEEYKFLQEMDYINGKRQIRASVHIGLDLTNIGGEIATYSGLGAGAGVALKTASAAGGILMSATRRFKQWGRDSAERKKGKGKELNKFYNLFDDSKGKGAKQDKIANDIGFIFKKFDGVRTLKDQLANVGNGGNNQALEGQIKNKIDEVKSYVEFTGASYSTMMRTYLTGSDKQDGVRKAAVYLMNCMKERE